MDHFYEYNQSLLLLDAPTCAAKHTCICSKIDSVLIVGLYVWISEQVGHNYGFVSFIMGE